MAQELLHVPANIVEILIVAPSDALRNSLSFLLEEESYRVTTASSIAEAMLLTEHFACTVLDHHAARDAEPADMAAFTQRHRPVVTLTNGLEGAGPNGSFRVVTKPFLGPALSQAVRDAVALGH